MVQYTCPHCHMGIQRPALQSRIHCPFCDVTFADRPSFQRGPAQIQRKQANHLLWIIPSLIGGVCFVTLFFLVALAMNDLGDAGDDVAFEDDPIFHMALDNGEQVELPNQDGKPTNNKVSKLVKQMLGQKPAKAAAPDKANDPELPHNYRVTKKEQARHRRVVARFILADVNQLPVNQRAKAFAEFNALGVEAIPALVEGVNCSADMSASCPIIVLSRKLQTVMRRCEDPYMIDYVYNNVGRGVTSKTWAGQIQGIRRVCYRNTKP